MAWKYAVGACAILAVSTWVGADVPLSPAPGELKLWVSADAAEASGGQKVTRWRDLSGNGFDLVTDAAMAPQLVADGPGGKPTVRFSADMTVKPPRFNLLHIPIKDEWKGMTLFVAGRDPNSNSLLGANAFGAPFWIGNSGIGLMSEDLHIANFNASDPDPTKADVICLAGGFDLQGDMRLTTYQNGRQLATASSATINTGINLQDQTLGTTNVYGYGPFRGCVSELLIYRGVISDEERRKVEHYLMAKYGVEPLASGERIEPAAPRTQPVVVKAPLGPVRGEPARAGLLIWSSADSLEVEEGAKVTSAPNRAGDQKPLVAPAGAEPTFVTNGVGGRPQLSFDGHEARPKNNPPLPEIAQVLKLPLPDANLKQMTVVVAGLNTAGRGCIQMAHDGGITSIGGYFHSGFPGVLHSPLSGYLVNGQIAVTQVQFDEQGGSFDFFLNGASVGHQTAPAGGRWNAASVKDPTIGISNAPWEHGALSEVLIYDHALSPQERQQTEAYLAGKYAIRLYSDEQGRRMRSKYSAYVDRLPSTQQWLCITFDGRRDWVQTGIFDTCLLSDGTVVCCSVWDEAHKEIGFYKDGKAIGGFRGAAQSLATDGDYLYVGGVTWGGRKGTILKRWSLKPSAPNAAGVEPNLPDIQSSSQQWPRPAVTDAPFPGVSPQDGLLVDKNGTIGLLVAGQNLIATFENTKEIRFYDKTTGQLRQAFPVDEQPGKLAADREGNFWAVVGDQVCQFGLDGRPTERKIAGLKPIALAVDGEGHLLVGDDGSRQQIVIFDAAANPPKEIGTIGQLGGVYAGNRPGGLTDDRLGRIRSVAVDGAGGVVVQGVGIIRKYDAQRSLKWQLESTSFCTVGDVDADSPTTDIYSGDTRYEAAINDPSHEGGWKWGAICTRPPRADGLGNGAQYEEVRRFDGRVYRLVHGQHLFEIQIQESNSNLFHTVAAFGVGENWDKDVTRPAGIPEKGRFVWCDRNDDGQIEPGEVSLAPTDEPRLQPYYDEWVDDRGDVWLPQIRNGIVHIPLQGWTRGGAPQYDLAHQQVVRRPPEFKEVLRCYYFPGADTMYLSGTTWEHPPKGNESWGGCGRECIRYADWSKSSRHIVSHMVFPEDAWTLRAMSVVDSAERVFVGDMDTACIFAYDSRSGGLLGMLEPDSAVVGPVCGWIDGSGGVRARQLKDRSLIVLAEDCMFGRQFAYRLPAPSPGK